MSDRSRDGRNASRGGKLNLQSAREKMGRGEERCAAFQEHAIVSFPLSGRWLPFYWRSPSAPIGEVSPVAGVGDHPHGAVAPIATITSSHHPIGAVAQVVMMAVASITTIAP